MTVLFTGHYTLTYPDYLDLRTGKVLVAEPGHSYTTAPAPGQAASLPAVPGDGRWDTAAPPKTARKPRQAATTADQPGAGDPPVTSAPVKEKA